MTVASILKDKGNSVHTISPDATVLDATRAMNDARVGSIVVARRGAIEGILTERDLLTRVLAVEMDPRRTLVREVMTRDVLACTPETSVDELRVLMHERRIRHVPVRDMDGRLCGLVSIGDLNARRAGKLAATVETLEMYITRG